MRSRALRVTLTLLAVIGIGAAAWFCWTLQTRINIIDDQAAAFVQARLAASRHAADLQAAQHAYVAAGQNEAFWFERVTAAGAALRSAIIEMDAATASPAARAEIAELTTLFEEFEDRDRRIRSYASAGQKLLAADVIFSDGVDGSARLHSTLERAAEAAAVDRAAERRLLSRNQALAVAGATAGAVLVMLLLVPLPPSPRPADAAPAPRVGDPLGLDLRPTRAVTPAKALPAKPMATRGPAPARTATPAAGPPPAARTPVPAAAAAATAPVAPDAPRLSLHLDDVASVCSDLARLDDTSALPAILERMARALDAPGLVLWVADADRSELMPIAAHGYPASVLARMRALPVTDENATTAAFRTGLLQTVSGKGETNGAIAAPLVSPGGCLGVMSAEVRHDGEKHPDRLAAATIVAAQLATIIGPPAARVQERSPAAL